MNRLFFIRSPHQEAWFRLDDIAHIFTRGKDDGPAGWVDDYGYIGECGAVVRLKEGGGDITLNKDDWAALRSLIEDRAEVIISRKGVLR